MLQDTTLQGWTAGVVCKGGDGDPSRCWMSPVLSVEVWERRGQPLQQPGLSSRITQPPWQGGSSELQPGQPTQ